MSSWFQTRPVFSRPNTEFQLLIATKLYIVNRWPSSEYIGQVRPKPEYVKKFALVLGSTDSYRLRAAWLGARQVSQSPEVNDEALRKSASGSPTRRTPPGAGNESGFAYGSRGRRTGASQAPSSECGRARSTSARGNASVRGEASIDSGPARRCGAVCTTFTSWKMALKSASSASRY